MSAEKSSLFIRTDFLFLITGIISAAISFVLSDRSFEAAENFSINNTVIGVVFFAFCSCTALISFLLRAHVPHGALFVMLLLVIQAFFIIQTNTTIDSIPTRYYESADHSAHNNGKYWIMSIAGVAVILFAAVLLTAVIRFGKNKVQNHRTT